MSNLNDLNDVLKQKKKVPVLTTTNDESYNWMAIVRQQNAKKQNLPKSKGIKGRRPIKENKETKNSTSVSKV